MSNVVKHSIPILEYLNHTNCSMVKLLFYTGKGLPSNSKMKSQAQEVNETSRHYNQVGSFTSLDFSGSGSAR